MMMKTSSEFEARRAQWLNTYKQDQMRKLDEQGRHRSEWCYSYYDGRQQREIPHGAGYEISDKDNPK